MSVVQQRSTERRGGRSPARRGDADHRAVGLFMPLRPALRLTPDGIQLSISGELDCSTSSRLNRLLTLLEGFSSPISVDLSGVVFTDSTGLTPLFDSAARRAESGSAPVCLVALSAPVRRVLEVLGDEADVKRLTRVDVAS